MSTKTPTEPLRPIADVLTGGKLGALAAEARRRRDLTAEVRSLLPEEIAVHLVTAGTTPTGELMLTMDASVWAARMRFHAEQLGNQRVKVRVRPGG